MSRPFTWTTPSFNCPFHLFFVRVTYRVDETGVIFVVIESLPFHTDTGLD